MTRNPRVSVGLVVYNGERYLAEALDSLLAQTFEDFELIICDNASTDRTEEIGRVYAARDRRVRYARNPSNLGAPRNHRRALALSRGQYFRWAAADDLLAPEYLARCVEVLDREPAVVLAYPKTRFIDEHGRVMSDHDDNLHLQSPRPSERFRQVMERLAYCHAVYGLMRADVLKRTGPFGCFVAADIVLLAELSLNGTFWEVPEFLFSRRFHPGAASNMNRAEIRAFYFPDRPHSLRMREWRHLWEHCRSVQRAPLAMAEKLRLAVFLMQMAAWRREGLLREVADAVRQLIRRPFHAAEGSG